MTKQQIKEAREAISTLSNFLMELSKLVDSADELINANETKEVFSQLEPKIEIDDILKRLNIDDTLKGYGYLKKAVQILVTEGTDKYKCNIMNLLLPKITEEDKTLEPTMRAAIKKGFKSVDKSDPLVRNLFEDIFLKGKEYPSVRIFLMRVANFVITAKGDRE